MGAAMSKKILIVDDEADIRTFLSAVLKKYGYEAHTAQNGSEGLEAALRERPDLIVMDIMMPKQSGPAFRQQLLDNEVLSQIPVIVVSGLASREAAVDTAVAVFDKPVNPRDFIAAVKKVLD